MGHVGMPIRLRIRPDFIEITRITILFSQCFRSIARHSTLHTRAQCTRLERQIHDIEIEYYMRKVKYYIFLVFIAQKSIEELSVAKMCRYFTH